MGEVTLAGDTSAWGMGTDSVACGEGVFSGDSFFGEGDLLIADGDGSGGEAGVGELAVVFTGDGVQGLQQRGREKIITIVKGDICKSDGNIRISE